MTSAARQKYCTGYAPFKVKGKAITCRKYAARINRKEYADANPHRPAIQKPLLGGLLNENRADLYQQHAEDDEAESTEEAHPDTTSDTYSLYMKGELYARLWDAYDKLEYTERMMLAQRLGFCFDCHSTFYMDYDDLDEYGDPKKKPIKPMMYTDIATDHEYSSANTAHKNAKRRFQN